MLLHWHYIFFWATEQRIHFLDKYLSCCVYYYNFVYHYTYFEIIKTLLYMYIKKHFFNSGKRKGKTKSVPQRSSIDTVLNTPPGFQICLQL